MVFSLNQILNVSPNLQIAIYLEFIIGFVEDNSGSVAKNLLLLLYKRYIYNNKISKSPLRFDGFKMFVKYVMKIEEKIALKNKRLSQHFQRWNFLTQLL